MCACICVCVCVCVSVCVHVCVLRETHSIRDHGLQTRSVVFQRSEARFQSQQQPGEITERQVT